MDFREIAASYTAAPEAPMLAEEFQVNEVWGNVTTTAAAAASNQSGLS